MRIERGSFARAVRYRVPDTNEETTGEVLRSFGLEPALNRLPDGQQTMLRHGGDPLTAPERARLLLARAMLGQPALLLLDHVDNDLGLSGREFLRERLDSYPGIVVMASDQPTEIIDVSHVWTPIQTAASES